MWSDIPDDAIPTFLMMRTCASAGEEHFVKYHFLPEAGVRNFTNAEATMMCGTDPDFAKRDLWTHIHKGGEAAWKAYIQIMTPEQAQYTFLHT